MDARDDERAAADDHGRRAMHQPGDDQGLVGTDDLHLHVEAHLEPESWVRLSPRSLNKISR